LIDILKVENYQSGVVKGYWRYPKVRRKGEWCGRPSKQEWVQKREETGKELLLEKGYEEGNKRREKVERLLHMEVAVSLSRGWSSLRD